MTPVPVFHGGTAVSAALEDLHVLLRHRLLPQPDSALGDGRWGSAKVEPTGGALVSAYTHPSTTAWARARIEPVGKFQRPPAEDKPDDYRHLSPYDERSCRNGLVSAGYPNQSKPQSAEGQEQSEASGADEVGHGCLAYPPPARESVAPATSPTPAARRLRGRQACRERDTSGTSCEATGYVCFKNARR
jgi:hypothetical protein